MRSLNAFINVQRTKTYKTRATAQAALDKAVFYARENEIPVKGAALIAQQEGGTKGAGGTYYRRFVIIIVNPSSGDEFTYWLHTARLPVFGITGRHG